MNQIDKYLEIAAKVSRLKDDDRTYFHGAVGIRKDGVLVCASNGNPKHPDRRHHCEYRLLKKLGKHGVIYLVRTLVDGTYGNSAPCPDCQKVIRSQKVKAVFFTGEKGQVRVWRPKEEWSVIPESWLPPTLDKSVETFKKLYNKDYLEFQGINGKHQYVDCVMQLSSPPQTAVALGES